jgi:hypothetical protein
VLHLLNALKFRCRGLADSDEMLILLDVCISHGVPYDQADAIGTTPVAYWQTSMADIGVSGDHPSSSRVLQHLTRKTRQWSVVPYISISLGLKEFYTAISEVLVIEADDSGTLPVVRTKLRLTSD